MTKNKAKVKDKVPGEEYLKHIDSRDKTHNGLLKNIKSNLPELELIFQKASDHWGYEDSIYRFYHDSFKVYRLQQTTEEIVKALTKISPHEKDYEPFHSSFEEIMHEGCSGREWVRQDNMMWTKMTRPIVEAFFHAKFFLEMAIKYGKELEEAPNLLPSGWAALLELYKIR